MACHDTEFLAELLCRFGYVLLCGQRLTRRNIWQAVLSPCGYDFCPPFGRQRLLAAVAAFPFSKKLREDRVVMPGVTRSKVNPEPFRGSISNIPDGYRDEGF